MKQNILCTLTAAALVALGITAYGLGAPSFAASTPTAPAVSTPSAVAEMTFTGTPIKLSLDQAVKTMQTTGPAAEAARIHDKSDKAIAEGHSQDASSINKFLKGLDDSNDSGMLSAPAGFTQTDRDIARLRRDFAKEHLDENAKSELNSIQSKTVGMYYDVLRKQADVTAAKDNLAVHQSILEQTQKKYDLGRAAKQELDTAKATVLQQKDRLAKAQTEWNTARMDLNYYMGYPLMQNVVLTDSLKQLEAPSMTLDTAIQNAQKNRLSIESAVLNEKVQAAYLKSLRYQYPSSSSTYMNQEIKYLEASQQVKSEPLLIEKEIRQKYMELKNLKAAITTAQTTLDNTKNELAAQQISFAAGLKTSTDVSKAQIAVFEAEQTLFDAIKQYDLAVYAYQYAQNVGTERVSL